MKATIVLRSPFLDKIPSLKSLIIYLAKEGYKVKVLTCEDISYPLTSFSDKNISLSVCKQRTHKLEMPTSVKMASSLMKDIIFDKSDIYIGGDDIGCEILLKLKKFFPIRVWDFMLEFPNINNSAEVNILSKSERIITHDKWHSGFLNEKCGIEPDKFLYLPNSTFTEVHPHHTDFLHKRLSLDKSSVILLHSGGLGKWFLCKELSEASKGLAKNQTVVFHTSHNVESTTYFQELKKLVEEGNLPVRFSLKPVTDDMLDELVASATIGLAFYSLEELGYRAEYMGLAAGKIGNYLKCGVPVIASNVKSLKYLDDYKCGILIDSLDELPFAVNKILADLDNNRQNAYRCYKELWEPTDYLKKIRLSIENK